MLAIACGFLVVLVLTPLILLRHYSVSEWANMWQLKIAASKCVARHISARSQLPSNDCPYSLCNMPLQWSVSTKDLGVDQHVVNFLYTLLLLEFM